MTITKSRYLDNHVAVPNVRTKNVRINGPLPSQALKKNPNKRKVQEMTKDGRVLFRNVKEMPRIPDGFALPVAPTKAELKEAENIHYTISTEGYTPIVSGPVEDLTIDGEEWSKKINESLKEDGLDALPKAPFVTLVLGSIAAGKTSALMRCLWAYAKKNRFSRVVIGSKSLGLDPMLKEVQMFRDPDVIFEVKKRISSADFEEQYNRVQSYFAPWDRLAYEGVYKKRPVHNNPEWFKRFGTKTHMDGDVHPYLDRDGNFHGLQPMFKDWSSQRMQPSKFSKRVDDSTEYRMMMTMVPMKEDVAMGYVIGKNLHRQEMMMNALLSYPNGAAAAAQLQKLQAAIIDPGVMRKHELPRPTLYIFEDAAYMTKHSDSMSLAEWMTIIRHLEASAMILVQQKSAAARVFRTIATDAFIFGVKNQVELDSIEEEFGSTITNFRQKFFAATRPIPGVAEKDFLNISLREPDVCYRSHHGKIVPIQEEVKAGEKHSADEDDDKLSRGEPKKKM